MSLLDPIISAGLANAALLGAAAAAAALRDRRWAWLAAFLALSFVTLCAIVIQHRSDGRSEWISVAVEQIAWGTGPLLYLFIRSIAGRSVTARVAAAHLVLPVAMVVAEMLRILIWSKEPLPAALLVGYQILYTLAACWTFVTRAETGERSLLAFWAPICALAAMVGVHAAQLVRWTPLGGPLADVVPVVGSAAILAALLALLTLPALIDRGSPRYSRSGLKPDEAARLFEAAHGLLISERLFTRHDLSLGDIAGRMRVSPHRLSHAFSAGGATFSTLIVGLRVVEARRLLGDPRNANVALEPIGMEAGFRSRSAFYSAFKALTGLTPGEFRDRDPAILSDPTGQDRESGDGGRRRA